MAGKGFNPERCENHKTDIKELQDTVYGNGHTGLVTIAALNSNFRVNFTRFTIGFLLLIAGGFLTQTAYLNKKINELEIRTATPTYQPDPYYAKQIKM